VTPVADLIERPAGWFGAPADRGAVVVSSRVRLARNCVGWAFHRTLPKARQQELVDRLLATAARVTGWEAPLVWRLSDLVESERTLLVERQLISRDLAAAKRPAAIFARNDERAALMLNEEDHLRLQVLAPGLDLQACMRDAAALDERLGTALGWACDARLGHLTACHTNVGTGLRASVMLHLPALTETGEIKVLLRGLARLELTVRGRHGEGSEPAGHNYQVSNCRSLGVDEDTIVQGVTTAAGRLVTAEAIARDVLMSKQAYQTQDRVHRAYGLLTHARSLSSDELNDQLSWVRLGAALGLLPGLDTATLDRLALRCQSAHLRLAHPEAEDAAERDRVRAGLVRVGLS